MTLMRKMTRRPLIVTLSVIAVSALVSGLGLFSMRAVAVVNEVMMVEQSGVLTLTSSLPRDELLNLTPEQPVYWHVGADLTRDLTGSLVLEIRKSGDLATHPLGLIVTIERCDEPWLNLDSTPSCGQNQQPVLVATPFDDNSTNSAVFDLAGITHANGKYLLVTLTLNTHEDRAGNDLMLLSGELGIGLTAAGDEVASEPGNSARVGSPSDTRGTLALTGPDALALFLVTLGALGLGAVFSLRRRSGSTDTNAHQAVE